MTGLNSCRQMLIFSGIERLTIFMHQFRYSRPKFNRGLIASLGLTAICTFLVFMLARILGFHQVWIITWAAGLIFFGFFPAPLLWGYLRNDVVLAIRPDGIFDARIGREPIAWDDIWEVALVRLEADWQLTLQLWPSPLVSLNAKQTGARDRLVIETTSLDANIDEIIDAIRPYKTVMARTGS